MRYGERTARGTAGGTKVTWALTLRDRIRVRSGKKIMVSFDTMKDIALLVCQRHELQTRGRIEHSQSGKGELQGYGQGMKLDEDSCEAVKVTCPRCKSSHDG